MIVGNVLKFGFGDVGVECDKIREEMIFKNIKPPQEIGTTLYPELDIEYGETIRFKEDHPYEFYKLIKTVNENNRIVEYKGYVFDFTEYNQDSVNVVLKFAKLMVNISIYAC